MEAEVGVMQLQGPPRIAWSHRQLGRDKEGLFPKVSKGGMPVTAPNSQDCERTHFCYSRPTSSCSLLRQPSEKNMP